MTKELAGRLPKSVRIAAFDFKIESWHHLVSTGAQRWGEFSASEFRISVQEDMPAAAKLVDTLLHEISHAIWWAYGLEDGDKEERIVRTMGSAWTQIWRDNPRLLGWLNEAAEAMQT